MIRWNPGSTRLAGVVCLAVITCASACGSQESSTARKRGKLEILLEGTPPEDRARLLEDLKETGHWRPEDLVFVVRELWTGPPIVRQSAARLLAEAGGEAEARWIALFLRDSDADLVMWSLIALKGIGEAASLAVDDIARVQLCSDAHHLRKIALETAWAVAPADPAVRDLVFDAAEDPAPIVREMAVNCLGEIGGPRAIRLVQRALRDPDANVRSSAERAMETLQAWADRGAK